MALTQEQKKKRLNDKGPMLLDELSPFFMNENILLQLVQGDRPILLPAQKSHLAYIPDAQKRCSKFLEELQAGPLRMYTDFISLLRRNNRDDIADVLEGTQSAAAACQVAGSPGAGTQSSTAASHQAGNPGDFKLDEKQVQKFLRKNGPAVMKNLKRCIGPDLLRQLMAGDALTEDEVSLINNERTPDEKVDKLIDFISEEDRFHYFREVLKERNENHIEKLIQNFLTC